MQRDALAGRRDHFECFQHRAGRGRGDFAERVAHIALEADDAAGDQSGDVFDGVLAEQPVKAVVDAGLVGGDLVFGRQHLGVAGRRDGVRHVEHGRDAAERRGGSAARRILLVRIAGIAEMHMHVDGAGQHMEAAGVERLARRRHRFGSADRENSAVLDRDAGREFASGDTMCRCG